MTTRLAGLSLTAPDFVIDEVMISMRAPAPVAGDSRLLNKQTAIRPSLIAHRRTTGAVATLEMLTGEVVAELVSSITGLSALTTETFSYVDGAVGVIVGFDFAAAEVGTARQYHALRLDDGVLTTLTLTIDGLTLTDSGKTAWLKILSSTSITSSLEEKPALGFVAEATLLRQESNSLEALHTGATS